MRACVCVYCWKGGLERLQICYPSKILNKNRDGASESLTHGCTGAHGSSGAREHTGTREHTGESCMTGSNHFRSRVSRVSSLHPPSSSLLLTTHIEVALRPRQSRQLIPVTRGATFTGDPPHSEMAFLSPPVLSLECDTKQGKSAL